MKEEAQKKGSIEPRPKIIVSSRAENGEEDALVVAYCCNCSYDPPMVMIGIVPSRYSYHIIKESKCFVVNLPEKTFRKEYDYLGSVSRRDENKFEKMHIQIQDGDIVNAPILTGCPVNVECTVVDSIKTGSHEMFVGKVEKVHADVKCLKDDGTIDFGKLDLIV